MNYEKSIPLWLEQSLQMIGVVESAMNNDPTTKISRDYSPRKIELDEHGEPPF